MDLESISNLFGRKIRYAEIINVYWICGAVVLNKKHATQKTIVKQKALKFRKENTINLIGRSNAIPYS